MKIYNTLTKKKETIKTKKAKNINLFVCGPTVYDFSHIGHARTFIMFDCFVKYLKQTGFKVFYLQNITDIDDRIIARAREKGVKIKDLASAFTAEYLKDMKLIGVNSVSKYAKATLHIKEIIKQVEKLLQKGIAYKLEDGVYFDISKFKNYGKLSRRTVLQSEDSVSRIDYSKNKKNRGDFCLWKLSFNEAEPKWLSPFGKGRPGWHIEDTAITEKYFGAQYDIHGGARDLIFPHHEAEIAQMESVSGKSPMAKYWMHTGFLNINEEKMSKSLGNFLMISQFLNRHSYQSLRFLFLKNLWRSPVNYSESIMVEVKSSLEKIEEFIRKINLASKQKINKKNIKTGKLFKQTKKDFYKNLDDDFNTPKAFASIFNFIKKLNIILEKENISSSQAKEIYEFFIKINKIFDVIDFKKLKQSNASLQVKNWLKEREKARLDKDWQKADEIRNKIEQKGYLIEDTEKGPILIKK